MKREEKIKDTIQLYNNKLSNLTSSVEAWQSFVKASAKFYKYSFAEQVLITTQRPDAEAVAEFDYWSKVFNRQIIKHSKGIPILDTDENGNTKLRYLFDVADTSATERSRKINIWQMKNEYINTVTDNLAIKYDVKGSDLMSICISLYEKQLAVYEKDIQDIIAAKDGSMLASLPDEDIRNSIYMLGMTSVVEAVYARCGMDAEIDGFQYGGIGNFNTPNLIARLGSFVSRISSNILRDIEREVRAIERSNKNERSNDQNDKRELSGNLGMEYENGEIYGADLTSFENRQTKDRFYGYGQNGGERVFTKVDRGERSDIHSGGGILHVPSAIGDPGTDGVRVGNVGQGKSQLSEERGQRDLGVYEDEVYASKTSDRNGESSQSNGRKANEAANGGRGNNRGAKTERPDRMGTPIQQLETQSVGDNSRGTDIRINDTETAEEAKSPAVSSLQIIGNIPFRYISQKTYRKLSDDISEALIVALESTDIKYSGKHNNDGTVTFTFSRKDIEQADKLISEAKENNKKGFNSDEVDIAKNTDIVAFLSSRGEQLKKVGGEYTMPQHDSMRINGNKFFWNSRNIGGNAVTFCMEYYGMDFKAAVGELLSFNGHNTSLSKKSNYNPPIHINTNKESEEAKEEHNPLLNPLDEKTSRVYAYLTKTRKIDGEIVNRFIDEGIIRQDINGNAVFLCFNSNNTLSGAELSGTLSDKKYKNNTERNGNGFTINPTKTNKPEKVIFFESAIDALSYYNMHRDTSALLVSMGGLKDKVINSTLKRYNIRPENAVISTDVDDAGTNFAEKIKNNYGIPAYSIVDDELYKICGSEKHKDWNDLLKSYKENLTDKSRELIEDLPKDENFYVIPDNVLENMPDTSISLEERNSYGYTWNGMLPLSAQRAEELFEQLPIYELSEDNTEHQIESIEELRQKADSNVMFGIEAEEWSKFIESHLNRHKESDTAIQIIGNTPYKYVPKKTYRKFEKELGLKIAYQLSTFSDIKYSGKIDDNGTLTLTFDGNRIDDVEKIINSLKPKEKANEETEFTALQEPDVEANKQEVIDSENTAKALTEEEVLFGQADLAKFLAERTPSSDEWEDMAYPMFENGYLNTHKPSDKTIFSYNLNEPELFVLAQRYHDGEDIRRELALGLLDVGTVDDIEFVFDDGKISERTYYYADNLRHSLHIEKTEDGFQCSFSGMERFVSFDDIGQAFLDRIHEEFEDLMYWRVLDYIKDDIPDISDETVGQLITAFDGAALPDWEKGDNQPKINRIKKALFDILGDEEQTEKAFACIARQKYNVTFEAKKQPDSLSFRFGKGDDNWISESELVYAFVMAHPNCSFALGNAIIEYLDEKQHSERQIEELHVGYYKKTDFTVSAVINGEEFNYEGRFDIGDGKGTGGGSLIDHIRDYNRGMLEYTQHPSEYREEYRENAQFMLDTFIPFLEKHTEMTEEEQKILDDFKEKYPIRPIDDVTKEQQETITDENNFTDDMVLQAIKDKKDIRLEKVSKSSEQITIISNAREKEIFNERLSYNTDGDIVHLGDMGKERGLILFNYKDTAAENILTELKNSGYKVVGIEDFSPQERQTEDIVKGKFQIYQLPDSDDYYGIRFEGTDTLKRAGVHLNHEDYNLVYEGSLEEFNGNATLEDIYTRFNMTRPDDFTGRSLSVSDVIVISVDDKDKAYFCDRVGFTEIPDFFRKKEINSEPFVKDTDFDTSSQVGTKLETAEQTSVSEPPKNFIITDNELGYGGQKEKYRMNIDAIKTLYTIEREERPATVQEQEILSKYVGWGGIADVFDERKANRANEYQELKELLPTPEYNAARASVNNAHFTSPVIIKAMYDVLANMGFKDGSILEPSLGIGNFFGMLPEEMNGSKLYGVEIDSITGRIAKQLYPNAHIQIKGFEKTSFTSNTFDVAIGNVPFGNYRVYDSSFKSNDLIHDFFFKKSLDKVRPGGVVAFITSKGTLDKQNTAVREYLAQRADLLGAIRLPNNAFKANAGTEVTSDIIFLQKRDTLRDFSKEEMPDWVRTAVNENGIEMNGYFINNPDMVLGEMVEVSGQYGMESTCKPTEGKELSELLEEAVSNIKGTITENIYAEPPKETKTDTRKNIYPENYRNFCYTVIDGDIYYRENDNMIQQNISGRKADILKGMIGISEILRDLIACQRDNYPDEYIKRQQDKLNKAYDEFTAKYGLIADHKGLFKTDDSSPLLFSLENLDENGKLLSKADIFTKRTIMAYEPVTSVDTASEALAVSISEKACVDLDFMSELCSKPKDDIIKELEGVIFENPVTNQYETSDEYLSGNVRKKLETAKEYAALNGKYEVNVKALESVQPEPLSAAQISVQLGASWVPVKYYEQFMYETFNTPDRCKSDCIWRDKYRNPFSSSVRADNETIMIDYDTNNAEYGISNKTSFAADRENLTVTSTYGTKRLNAYQILESSLNQKPVKVVDYVDDGYGKKKAVPNEKETFFAQEKQNMIKQKFQEWIFDDFDRAEELCRIYNEKFNSVRLREYDGSHLNFVGMNPEITLRKHQVDAIAHTIYGGNTLLAHTVGAGKSFEMIASAMESKRLGLCSKSLICVPKHIVNQFAKEFLQLYPGANILVPDEKDFSKANRQKFCSRIATGNYDAIILSHTQLEKIPLSEERQREFIQAEIEKLTYTIGETTKDNNRGFTVKQLEGNKKNLEARLEKLNNNEKRDTVVTFEELGVDRLYIDEAHAFKNLYFTSKMGRNVSGINTSSMSQRATDLYMKVRYLDEITDSRGTTFATGTAISNSMTELFTMQTYLQRNKLEEQGLLQFDAWASCFGEAQQRMELSPEGKGFQLKTRFAKFNNLPELMTMFGESADIKTAEALKLPVPEAEFHIVSTKASEFQKEMVDALAERADKVRKHKVRPEVDNMLNITNDGRKLALDQRIANPLLPDDENSKVNKCVENVFDIWEKTTDKKSAQMIFCDLSTPHYDGNFNVYDDIKQKLISKGIPEKEIAFIHDCSNDAQKQALFTKVRNGEVRVLLGSTNKMGTGTNCQQRLIALHHLDCPYRPADLEQRNGRIIRQGNENEKVDIYNYVTEGTFDAYLYQLVESKQRFISQIMTNKFMGRSAEDVDEAVLSYAQIKSIATGNPKIREQMDLNIEVNRLRTVFAAYQEEKRSLQEKINHTYPERISSLNERISSLSEDIKLADKTKAAEFLHMTVGGITYSDKKEAGTAFLESCRKILTSDKNKEIGEYRGFKMYGSFNAATEAIEVTLKGKCSYVLDVGTDIYGNITRLDNVINSLPSKYKIAVSSLENTKSELEKAKIEVAKPFGQLDELREKEKMLNELTLELSSENNAPKADTDKTDEDIQNKHKPDKSI